METKEIKINLNGYRTVQDFMDFKQITHRTVYHWIESGKLETKKILGRTLVKEKK